MVYFDNSKGILNNENYDLEQSIFMKYIKMKKWKQNIMSTIFLWWCSDQTYCSGKIKIIDLPLCSLKSFSNISKNEAYEFKESKFESSINDTLVTK